MKRKIGKGRPQKQESPTPCWEGHVTRNDKNPEWAIKIEAPIYVRDKTKSGDSSGVPAEKVWIKLYASRSGWRKLWNFYVIDNGENFSNQLWTDFFYPAVLETKDWRGSGMGKPNRNLVRVLKTDASNLFSFFFWWLERPRSNWPDYLQQVIKVVLEEGVGNYDPAAFKGLDIKSAFNEMSEREKATLLTDWCIYKVHYKKWHDEITPHLFGKDSHAFYETYCRPDRTQKSYIEIKIMEIEKDRDAKIAAIRQKNPRNLQNQIAFAEKNAFKKIGELVLGYPIKQIFEALKAHNLIKLPTSSQPTPQE